MRTQLTRAGKRLLVLLSYPSNVVADTCRGGRRPDEEFVRQLDERQIDYVDSLAGHVADYAAFSIQPDEYVARYYDAHYTPGGNHWFAYFVKPAIVRWLETLPPAYPADHATSATDRGAGC
jgi:hypothetical protein